MHAQSARLYLPNGDQLGWVIPVPMGASRIEPGITPTGPIDLNFATWTDFVDDCGQSRVWAGVHFQAAVDASKAMCDEFGNLAYAYLGSLIDGSAPPRPPSMGR